MISAFTVGRRMVAARRGEGGVKEARETGAAAPRHAVWRDAALLFSLAAAAALSPAAPAAAETKRPLSVIVMDPLAAPLACDCVKGFAQRRYEKLAERLQERLDRPVQLAFAESIPMALRGAAKGRADLVIGKDSVVRYDAPAAKLDLRPLALLTDKTGLTTLTGLFVVPSGDAARRLEDLAGYEIYFGPEEELEKRGAALAAARQAGIPLPDKPVTRNGCSDAVLDMLESERKPGTAAVISNYSFILLEGCGTIDKGSIRVVGRTEPVPFVAVYASQTVSQEQGRRIFQALRSVAEDPALLEALESSEGFVAYPSEKDGKPEPRQRGADRPPSNREDREDPEEQAAGRAASPGKPGAEAVWPGWRGPNRDALVPWLPDRLPGEPKFLWKKRLTGMALAGLAASRQQVIVADRDAADLDDIFRCLDAASGLELWKLQYAAPGKLDYGNSPRATPLLAGTKAYLLGAMGHLHCVRLSDGNVVWRKNLQTEFDVELTAWGMCSSPLIVDGKLIVNPGARDASVVALDPDDGSVIWKTPGGAVAYASFIAGTFGGVRQLVGYDAVSLGGWDIATGKRLWRLVPPEMGDFNVPTPVDLGGRLLVTSENNGTRVYGFDGQGRIVPEPEAAHRDLAPDSSTPVVLGGRVLGCWEKLFCLDAARGLREIGALEAEAFDRYASLIGSGDRALLTADNGEVILLRLDGEACRVVSRWRPFGEDCEVIAHPAVAGRRLFLRSDTYVGCLELE